MERITGRQLEIIRLWRNPSVRRLATIIVSTWITALLLIVAYTAYETNQLKQEWLDREVALIGVLSSEHPELAETLPRLVMHNVSEEDIAKGYELAAEYGFSNRLDAGLIPILSDYRTRTWALLVISTSFLISILAFILLREYRIQLSNMRMLAISLEETVKHNRPMDFRIHTEGELGLLAHSAQELALRLQQTIEQLQLDKTYLRETVADISHQLKTPLASLIIYVELLQDGRVTPDEATEFLGISRRELDRMQWLTLTLLKIARLEAGSLDIHTIHSPIAETVDEALEPLRRLADERSVHVIVDESASPIHVLHDPRWLAEAIGNIAKNAIEHSPSGGTVSVTWEQTSVFVRLHITNEGTGIDRNHIPHIFKKFYRQSPEGSGVGLGLPLAKSIIELHQGIVSVSSPAEGGTVFTMTLPLQPLL